MRNYLFSNDIINNAKDVFYLIKNNIKGKRLLSATYSVKTKELKILNVFDDLPDTEVLEEFVNLAEDEYERQYLIE